MKKTTTLAIAGIFVFLITLLTYLPNVRNEFVCYDDIDYIISNKAIAEGLTPRSICWSFASTGYASNWHPLTWLSHAFDITVGINLRWDTKALSGPFARFVHTENIIIHSFNAVLLWLVLTLLLAPPKQQLRSLADVSSTFSVVLAGALALFWSLHPLRVEVVAWAAERKELLSVFFMLLTLVLFISEDGPRRLQLTAYALALLAKPVAVSLPVLLVFYDVAFRGKNIREATRSAFPFFEMAILTSVLTMVSQKVALDVGGQYSLGTRILCAVEAPIIYIWQTLCPTNLCLDYRFPDVSSWSILALGTLLLIVMAVSFGIWLFRRRGMPYALTIVWSYIGLLPMIGIVKVGNEPHNDRYTYWIACGVVSGIALVVAKRRNVCERFGRLIACGCGVVLIALSLLSVRQSSVWQCNNTLLSDIISKTHDERATQGLAELLVLEGGEKNVLMAEKMLRETLAIRDSSRAKAALALHLLGYGTEIAVADEAKRLTAEALEGDAKNGWAYAAQALIDYHEQRYEQACQNMNAAKRVGFSSILVNVDTREWERLIP